MKVTEYNKHSNMYHKIDDSDLLTLSSATELLHKKLRCADFLHDSFLWHKEWFFTDCIQKSWLATFFSKSRSKRQALQRVQFLRNEHMGRTSYKILFFRVSKLCIMCSIQWNVVGKKALRISLTSLFLYLNKLTSYGKENLYYCTTWQHNSDKYWRRYQRNTTTVKTKNINTALGHHHLSNMEPFKSAQTSKFLV